MTVLALHPEIGSYEQMMLKAEDSGRIVRADQDASATSIRVCTDVDVAQFKKIFAEALQ